MKMDEDEDREPIAMNYYILSPDSARQRKQARLFAASPNGGWMNADSRSCEEVEGMVWWVQCAMHIVLQYVQ